MKKLNKCCNDYLQKIKPVELERVEIQPFQLDLVDECEKLQDKVLNKMDETIKRAEETRLFVKSLRIA